MRTYIDFIAGIDVPFSFQAVLDGNMYNITVTWNIFGLRYYVNVFDAQGNLILTTPMVGSPDDYDISIVGNKFISALIYRVSSNRFEVADSVIAYPEFGQRSDYILDMNGNVFILDQSILG